MRIFHFERLIDESGVSGTGRVAEGVELSNGKCVVSWLTPHTSVCIYDSIAEVEAIHGHGGHTQIVFDEAGGAFPARPAGMGRYTTREELLAYKPDAARVGYYVQYAGPATGGRCVTEGPFASVREASAAQKSGASRMPFDGWMQVVDGTGQAVLVT